MLRNQLNLKLTVDSGSILEEHLQSGISGVSPLR